MAGVEAAAAAADACCAAGVEEEGTAGGGRQPSRWGRGYERWLVIGRPSMLVATDMLFGRPRIRSALSSAGWSIASRVEGRSSAGRRPAPRRWPALLSPLALLGRAASMVPSGRPVGSSSPGRESMSCRKVVFEVVTKDSGTSESTYSKTSVSSHHLSVADVDTYNQNHQGVVQRPTAHRTRSYSPTKSYSYPTLEYSFSYCTKTSRDLCVPPCRAASSTFRAHPSSCTCSSRDSSVVGGFYKRTLEFRIYSSQDQKHAASCSIPLDQFATLL